MKIRYVITAVIFVLSLSIPAVSAAGYSGPAPLEPRLSSDGNTLYNAIPPVVLLEDPNPPAERMRIPVRRDMLTPPEKATASFSITYVANGGTDNWGAPCTTFPEEAKVPFNAAAAVWGNLLKSSVPIRITACWSDLAGGTLGYSGGGTRHANFTNAPLADTWYAGSLANALAGSDLAEGYDDMHITYNSDYAASFYYGTDGEPAGKIDFMSVVLHEIAHGLNFSGSMAYNVSTTMGSWGYGYPAYPNIYDTFMRDGTANPGNLLINAAFYANPSVALGSALRSDSVWFHGTNAMAANGGGRVKMYAPATWASGSSYSHLDYSTFVGTANRLMVYSLSPGVAVHDPGPVTVGMFKDMGWPMGENSTLYANFTGAGLYSWNGSSWTQLHSAIPESMAASGSSLYVNFTGYGLYKWSGTAWSQLHSAIPANMAASGTDLYANFTGYGLYRWNGTAWSQLHTVIPANMVASGTDLYANFTGYGLYKWNGTAWSKLHTVIPANMVASGSDLYANFTGYGLYKWNGTAWSQLHTVIPASMVVSGSTLYANFAGYGLYAWNGSAWTQINSTMPANMITGF
jgi:hypothetical protein